ncbi:MAG TPA: Dabb family protein [Bryobacteraceae bacterium]|nr:Dabb family protein [Bryobacteraceae bacterium]
MKKIALALLAVALVATGLLIGANTFNAPPTILHVVTVKWKADSTPQQQQAAIDGIKKMAADVPGLKNIWVKKIKVQPADYSASFAMEFESKAAFDAYTNSAAHKAWEKLYLPLREESHTQDITN